MSTKFDYDKTYTMASRLLDKFGTTIMVETPERDLHKGYGVFSQIEQSERPANLVEENILEFWLSGDIEYTPILGDYLLAGTEVWAITQVERVQPGPKLLMYRLVVKL